ncbi:efflux RND transporter periplasmic adaptor subunit [Alkalilimnicola ehrlichii MLHE-1]|uniref:Efflux transporter, RND family, MFP subunit n=1 Tax=Alkalilimnicola ehrlichii (strain ATCC BAA-1101 / DSM 17681 / MLHE-1) TaxID=187272 RepID=Q0A9C9_ALKEH|nr:HlyD family efflux transporter periplasmic adaptor subunit [Alkalilimnicola ehrlichii]ABI56558.1 efflux transporter, RND family, MFP subunit [Alkalilimnicola ehrlichii MLHE-1]
MIGNKILQFLLPPLVIAAGVALFIGLRATAPETEPQPVEEPAWTVDSTVVTPAPVAPRLRLSGHLESPRTSALTAAVEADVIEVSAREGRRVAAGERLVQLDGTDLELQVREQRAEINELQAQLALEEHQIEADRRELASERELEAIAERELGRVQRLADRDLASGSDLDGARRELAQQRMAVSSRRLAVDSAESRLAQLAARLDRAEALHDRLARDLGRTTVRAPFAGRVAEVSVSPGDRVRPGEPLVEVYDSGALEVRAHLPAGRIGPIRRVLALGTPLSATAVVDAEPLRLELDRLGGRSDRGEGGVTALFRVTEGGEDLPLGRFVALEAMLPVEPDAVVLPFEALYGTRRVYRLEEGRMRAVEVERLGEAPLPDGRRGMLVRSPELTAGTRVVVTQIPRAMDGLRVRDLGSEAP